MAEFKFVVKVFLITGVVVFLMQFKIGNESLEEKTHYLVTESSTAHEIRKGIRYSLRFLGEKFNFVSEKAKQSAEQTQDSVGSHLSSFGKKASKAIKELPTADFDEGDEESLKDSLINSESKATTDYPSEIDEGVL